MAQNTSRTTDMTRGSPLCLILAFSLPLILANVGQQLYMIVDASVVGRGVGVKALAAVGSSDWCYWLILWTVIGLTQGFSVFVSRFFGEKNFERMNRTIAMSVLLCLAVGVFLTVAGIAVTRPVLMLLKTPADIIDSSALYLRTMIAGTIVVTAYNMASSILRALGDGKTPFVAMCIAAVMNITLDLAFVLVFRWGVFGAALASVIAQGFSFAYCLFRITRIKEVCLSRKTWKPDTALIFDLLRFGFPIAVQSIIIALSGIVLQSAVNVQGSVFVAGYTSTNKLYGLLESTAISVGLAASTYFAQNFGAGNMRRVRRGLRASVLIVLLMAVIVTTVSFGFGKTLLALFIDSKIGADGEEALRIGSEYLRIMSSFLIVLYLIHIYKNALQAMGVSVWSMVSGFAEAAARVATAKIAVALLGSRLIFFAEPAAWAFALAFIAAPYYAWAGRKMKENKPSSQKEISR